MQKALLPHYTFAQSIHTRTSYQDEKIEMGARFEELITKTV
ncbi:hypothetical protein [Pedobacter sp.]